MPGRRAPSNQRRAEILGAALAIATTDGLDAVTVRCVAAKSRLSAGLVLFHFQKRALLIHALLERILADCTLMPVSKDGSAESAFDTLARVVESEMGRLSDKSELADVFFEFWVLGLREPSIRRRMRRALRTYREGFEPLAAAAIRERPKLFRGVSREGLATIAVATVQGTVLQACLDRGRVDVAASQRAFHALSRELVQQWRSRSTTRPREVEA